MKAYFLLPLCCGLLLVSGGCSPSKVQVSGRILWTDGKPATELANGQVIFESAETRISGRGIIQPDGTFRINTEGPNDGILPGVYQVALLEHRPVEEGQTKLPPQYLQDFYYSFDTSGLTATVQETNTEIELRIERMPKH